MPSEILGQLDIKKGQTVTIETKVFNPGAPVPQDGHTIMIYAQKKDYKLILITVE